MVISAHAETFAGYRVRDYDPEAGAPAGSGAKGVIYRLRVDYESREGFNDLFDRFLSEPGAAEAQGLVIGSWFNQGPESSEPVVEALVAARDRLPHLRALFLGDIVSEECEISWIEQSDVSPLFTAYPGLEYFRVRGGNGLTFGSLRHERLKSLAVESGGLPENVLAEIGQADLPLLEHLELWLGSPEYGGIDNPGPLAAILAGSRFPRLRSLGLRDSEIADEVAEAVESSPLLQRIRVLDLSLGTLGDRGARALLASPAVRRLEKLDIHHHFVSEAVVNELRRLGIEVDASEPQHGGEDHRYCAVSE